MNGIIRLWYDLTKEKNPWSTDCEANAVASYPPHRFVQLVSKRKSYLLHLQEMKAITLLTFGYKRTENVTLQLHGQDC